jgi:hypothetical protein
MAANYDVTTGVIIQLSMSDGISRDIGRYYPGNINAVGEERSGTGCRQIGLTERMRCYDVAEVAL